MQRKCALVTGASSGIGKGIARVLAENGYDVGISFNQNEAGARDTLDQVAARGARGVLLQADVTDMRQNAALAAAFLDAFGRVDLLVNNAGITRAKPFLDVDEALFDDVLGLDLKGSFFLSQHIARRMVADKTAGRIVNITSNHQQGCWPGSTVYAASKAALMKFTQNCAMELAPYKITVNAIAPGYTVIERMGDYRARYAGPLSRIPLKRFLTPEEVGHAVVYLASEQAGYITGTCLTMDGGALLPAWVAQEPQ